MDFEQIFYQYKEPSLSGRYITLHDIEPALNKIKDPGQLTIIGKSVLGKSIYGYKTGTGKIKILVWSQMHGNESTTTKALFDLFNLLNSNSGLAKDLLRKFTFFFIPMVNPDGAMAYTRANANNIDLNRDAQDLSQPESQVLREAYETFMPDYCYNMHDQRTIFGAGNSGKPATVSFLAPSYNQERHINDIRKKAIHAIVSMNNELQRYIPGQVGRFDDDFNINCAGDMFQFLGTPTILFEAGHFQGDYDREETRKYIFIALLSGFKSIYENVIVNNETHHYLKIPQNNSNFFDFVYKNIKINYDDSEIITNFAAQYNEELINNTIFFNAFIVKIGNLEECFGHVEFDAAQKKYSDDVDNIPRLNQKALFYIENIKIINGSVQPD